MFKTLYNEFMIIIIHTHTMKKKEICYFIISNYLVKPFVVSIF